MLVVFSCRSFGGQGFLIKMRPLAYISHTCFSVPPRTRVILRQPYSYQPYRSSYSENMAEIFGTVAGALSVAALFADCVDCFEYVQLGRHFGQDFERCRLKVDIAQTRLSRWGEAVAIHEDPRFATTTPADAPTRQVQSVLEEIDLLFNRSKRNRSSTSWVPSPTS